MRLFICVLQDPELRLLALCDVMYKEPNSLAVASATCNSGLVPWECQLLPKLGVCVKDMWRGGPCSSLSPQPGGTSADGMSLGRLRKRVRICVDMCERCVCTFEAAWLCTPHSLGEW